MHGGPLCFFPRTPAGTGRLEEQPMAMKIYLPSPSLQMQLEKRAPFTLNLRIDGGRAYRLTAAFSYSNQERKGMANST